MSSPMSAPTSTSTETRHRTEHRRPQGVAARASGRRTAPVIRHRSACPDEPPALGGSEFRYLRRGHDVVDGSSGGRLRRLPRRGGGVAVHRSVLRRVRPQSGRFGASGRCPSWHGGCSGSAEGQDRPGRLRHRRRHPIDRRHPRGGPLPQSRRRPLPRTHRRAGVDAAPQARRADSDRTDQAGTQSRRSAQRAQTCCPRA